LLLALDVYGLHGWLRECRVWHEPPGASVLAVLLFASAVVIVRLLNNIKCSTRLRRSIRNMPPLDESKSAALRKTLPDLDKVTLRVYPCNAPQSLHRGLTHTGYCAVELADRKPGRTGNHRDGSP
jgi:hypothetical protein